MEDIKKEVSEQLNHYKESLDNSINESYEIALKSSKLTRDLLLIIKGGAAQHSDLIRSLKNYLIDLGINSNVELSKDAFHKKVSNIVGLDRLISKSSDLLDSLDEENPEEVAETLNIDVKVAKSCSNMVLETHKHYTN